VINTGKVALKVKLGVPEKIDLPWASRLLRTGIDPWTGAPALWFRYPVQTSETPQTDKRTFLVTTTGIAVPDETMHCGMWWMGAQVFHLWELYPDEYDEHDPSLLVNIFAKEAEEGDV